VKTSVPIVLIDYLPEHVDERQTSHPGHRKTAVFQRELMGGESSLPFVKYPAIIGRMLPSIPSHLDRCITPQESVVCVQRIPPLCTGTAGNGSYLICSAVPYLSRMRFVRRWKQAHNNSRPILGTLTDVTQRTPKKKDNITH